MTSFIDASETYGPFSGALLILNVGRDNYEKIGITEEYEESLIEAIAMAHADGWATIYLFDDARGVSLIPEGFEDIEDMNFCRLLRPSTGMPSADFSIVPSEREKQFAKMLERLWKMEDFSFRGSSASIAGLCKIGGEEVLLPVTCLQ